MQMQLLSPIFNYDPLLKMQHCVLPTCCTKTIPIIRWTNPQSQFCSKKVWEKTKIVFSIYLRRKLNAQRGLNDGKVHTSFLPPNHPNPSMHSQPLLLLLWHSRHGHLSSRTLLHSLKSSQINFVWMFSLFSR